MEFLLQRYIWPIVRLLTVNSAVERLATTEGGPEALKRIANEVRVGRRKIGRIFLYRRNFITGGFYGASNFF